MQYRIVKRQKIVAGVVIDTFYQIEEEVSPGIWIIAPDCYRFNSLSDATDAKQKLDNDLDLTMEVMP